MSGKGNSDGASKKPSAREDRLKAALKANVQKRKAQAKVRQGKNDNDKAD